MNWYAAKLIFESRIDATSKHDALWEESIRIFFASSEEDARSAALAAGKLAEHSYQNEVGETVSWHFREVQEIQDLCLSDLTSGAEVFSRLFRQ